MIDSDKGKVVKTSTNDEVETLLTHAENYQQLTKDTPPECGTKQELDWLFETSVTHNSLPFVFLTHR